MKNEKELRLELKNLNEKLKKLRKENSDLKKRNIHLVQSRSIDLKDIERLQESDECLKSEVMRKAQIISEITDEQFEMEKEFKKKSIGMLASSAFLVISVIYMSWLRF